MSKNVVIFSDGTGQAGGVRPDQRLSNVYKLFRASRSGPDSPIDPSGQVAFYEAGLGTDDDVSGAPTRFVRWLRKLLGSATGRGITQNIIDCYSKILDNYETGDRIFLFGFSRGAYTARCVANLLELCGIPTVGSAGTKFPRGKLEARDIAAEAVHKVYEHGAGRSASKFDAERKELARRFRRKYQCGDDHSSNAHPHFVGVFDTVASLGAHGPVRALLICGLLAGLLVSAMAVAGLLALGFASPFWRSTAIIFGAAIAGFAISSVHSTLHWIKDFPAKGDLRWHIAKWEMKNYDQRLPHGIRFARHALAIDETRADFPRVKWGWKGHEDAQVVGEPMRFIQLWFAGNHSDVGGSYPEEQSRLSDITLKWMIDQATTVPGPLVIDHSKLNLFPAPSGMQHCEVDATRDLIGSYFPKWLSQRWKPSWRIQPRTEVLDATMHVSVEERFALPNVWKCGVFAAYRPETLRTDRRFAHFYDVKPL